MPTDMLGDSYDDPVVKLEDNKLLEGIANHILDLVKHYPNLIEGKTVGEIDRKLKIAFWLESVKPVIQSGSIERFIEWAKNSKLCVDNETISRARRFLVERDLIRLPSSVILEAERHRQRIARSVK
jgi:hypothetical protein